MSTAAMSYDDLERYLSEGNVRKIIKYITNNWYNNPLRDAIKRDDKHITNEITFKIPDKFAYTLYQMMLAMSVEEGKPEVLFMAEREWCKDLGIDVPIGPDTTFDNPEIFGKLIPSFAKTGTMLEYLIKNFHADINARDCYGRTLIYYCDNFDTFYVALREGAKLGVVDDYENTPLDYAVAKGQTEKVQWLFTQGVDINAKDSSGKTMLHRCAGRNIPGHILEIFSGCGADVNAKDNRGDTPLHYAAKLGNLHLMEWLIENGAAVNTKDNGGETPLHCAVTHGELPLVALLIQHGAAVNTKDNEGKTPLYCAVPLGGLPLVALLIQHGAAVNPKDNKGKTPLHYAVMQRKPPLTVCLIENGADVNAQDNSGKTPLHYAAEKGFLPNVMFLLKNDADPNAKTKSGDTPLHMTEDIGKIFVLYRSGANPDNTNNNGEVAVKEENRKILDDRWWFEFFKHGGTGIVSPSNKNDFDIIKKYLSTESATGTTPTESATGITPPESAIRKTPQASGRLSVTAGEKVSGKGKP